MTHPPFFVAGTRTGTCLECARALDSKPHGVRLRVVGERTIATIALCKECFARALHGAERSGGGVEGSGRRDCEWAGPDNTTCGHPASVNARATRKDGSAVTDLALCDEHFTAFKVWRHDYAITVHRLSAPHESA